MNHKKVNKAFNVWNTNFALIQKDKRIEIRISEEMGDELKMAKALVIKGKDIPKDGSQLSAVLTDKANVLINSYIGSTRHAYK